MRCRDVTLYCFSTTLIGQPLLTNESYFSVSGWMVHCRKGNYIIQIPKCLGRLCIQYIIITTIQIWPIKFNMFPEAFAAFILYSFSSSLVNNLGGGELLHAPYESPKIHKRQTKMRAMGGVKEEDTQRATTDANKWSAMMVESEQLTKEQHFFVMLWLGSQTDLMGRCDVVESGNINLWTSQSFPFHFTEPQKHFKQKPQLDMCFKRAFYYYRMSTIMIKSLKSLFSKHFDRW